ncbi:hypothetical protein Aoki45_37920 [Algoriphagus sp. oki45]|uniref:hypothetical protein n=1 Tax=Algoriphagus sp. oki45 TaxID=3067294 RepID=UPI0027EFC351|nr:hypothetical protein Aoki45_37920 [Algoriphagus sp. oki45]
MKRLLILFFGLFLNFGAQAQGNLWTGVWSSDKGELSITQAGGYIYGVHDQWVFFGKVYPGGRRAAGTFVNSAQKSAGRFDIMINGDNLSFSGFLAPGEDFRVLTKDNAISWDGNKTQKELLTFSDKNGNSLVMSEQGMINGRQDNGRVFYGKAKTTQFDFLTADLELARLDPTGKRADPPVKGELILFSDPFNPANVKMAVTGVGSIARWQAAREAEAKRIEAQNKAEASKPMPKASSNMYRMKMTYNDVTLTKARVGRNQRGDLSISTLIQGPKPREEQISYVRDNRTRGKSNFVWFGWMGNNFGTTWPEGQKRNIGKFVIWNIPFSTAEIQSSTMKITTSMRFSWGPNLLAADMWGDRSNNLAEIIKFLSGQTQAGDYPNASGGRKRLPNSDETFWLETVGGKRYVRGEGEMYDDKDHVRFRYTYTLELID